MQQIRRIGNRRDFDTAYFRRTGVIIEAAHGPFERALAFSRHANDKRSDFVGDAVGDGAGYLSRDRDQARSAMIADPQHLLELALIHPGMSASGSIGWGAFWWRNKAVPRDDGRERAANSLTREREFLERLFRADKATREMLVAGVAAARDGRIDALIGDLTRRHGEFVGARGDGSSLLLEFARGSEPALVQLDSAGTLTGLLLGAGARPWPWWSRRPWAPLLTLCQISALIIYVVGGLVAFWSATSMSAWGLCIANVALVAPQIWAVAGWPRFYFSQRTRRMFAVAGGIALLSITRLSGAPVGRWPTWGTILLMAACVNVVSIVNQRRYIPGPVTAARLRFPLRQGRTYVVQGGGRRLNGHFRSAAQRGAVDLVALRPSGARACGVMPRELQRYAAYGMPVVAPCSGRALVAVDHHPDQVPWDPVVALPLGNHVVLSMGTERIVLAHLKPDSVRVRSGDQVAEGQLLGEVGNSGRSSEPHLHVHAERTVGERTIALSLRFRDVEGMLYRGRVIKSAASAKPSVRQWLLVVLKGSMRAVVGRTARRVTRDDF